MNLRPSDAPRRMPSTPVGGRRSAGPVVRMLTGIVVGLLAIMVAAATPATAHARLLGTSPESGSVLDSAPTRVELRFSEPVGLITDGVRLFASDGQLTTLDAHSRDAVVSAELPALPDGGYTVGFRVVSADGHPISGAVSFRIGATAEAAPPVVDPAPTPVADGLVAALSAAQAWALLVLAGLIFFHQVVPPDRAVATRRGGRGDHRLLRTLLLVTVAASLALVPAEALRAVGAEPWGVADFGWLAGVRPEPVAAALVITGAGRLALWASGRSGRTRWWAAPFAGMALAALLLIGHTRTIGPTWLMAIADFGHLLAAAVWTGGLAGLIRLLVHARGPAGARTSEKMTAVEVSRVVGRFSQLALVSVLLLAVSGTTMAILVVGSWSMLVESGYGRTLLLKLGVVVAVVAIAGWNRFVMLPRIERPPDDEASWHRLLRALRREAALLVAVVAITGVLTNTSPGPSLGQEPDASPTASPALIPISVTSQGLTVDGSLSPATTGTNRLRLRLSVDGRLLTTDEVAVTARLPEQDLGPLTADVTRDPGSSDYLAEILLPVAGQWRLEIAARLDSFTKPTAVIAITIG